MASTTFRSVKHFSAPVSQSFGRVSTCRTGFRHFHMTSPRAALYPNANAETFKKVVGTDDRVVIVDFYADWCGPCHQLSPVIERLTQEPNKSGSGLPLDLVKVDVESEDGMELARRFKVSAMPTVIAFRDGEQASKFVGAVPERRVKDFLQDL